MQSIKLSGCARNQIFVAPRYLQHFCGLCGCALRNWYHEKRTLNLYYISFAIICALTFYVAPVFANAETDAPCEATSPVNGRALLNKGGDYKQEDRRRLAAQSMAHFGRLTSPPNLDDRIVALGRRLFHEPKLSANNLISCASCHVLDTGGDDDRQFSFGVSGAPSKRNSPSVYNLEGHVAYFWDGRAKTLEEQVDGPVSHPDEMGSSWDAIVTSLKSDDTYVYAFQKAFGGPPSAEHVRVAIATFERSLVTNNSAFDRFIAGNHASLDGRMLEGLDTFLQLGCASCHQGPLLGGNLFQKFGVFAGPEVSENPDELFKVPSLRNVAVTAPYFHDGQTQDLCAAVDIMSEYQLGHSLSNRERNSLVYFLRSLTDELFLRSDQGEGDYVQ